MSLQHGSFILLQDGKAVCYSSDYATITERLTGMFAKLSNAEYVITQVVGTVDKPQTPVVHSVYGANL